METWMPTRTGSARHGVGMGGAHLVKEAILANELLSGLGVDGDGEPHVCHQELCGGARENIRESPARNPDLVCASSAAPRDASHPQPVHDGGVIPGLGEEVKVGRLVFTAE